LQEFLKQAFLEGTSEELDHTRRLLAFDVSLDQFFPTGELSECCLDGSHVGLLVLDPLFEDEVNLMVVDFLALFSLLGVAFDLLEVIFDRVQDLLFDGLIVERLVDDRLEARSGVSHKPMNVVLELSL
jgi:hypothetical protein